MKITVDSFVNLFTNLETGLPRNRIMIVSQYGELIFDSNRPEDSEYGIIELPILESEVKAAFTNDYGTLTIVL